MEPERSSTTTRSVGTRTGDCAWTASARSESRYTRMFWKSAVDATSYFSRPGPRIVDGLEILAWAVHPDFYPEPPDGTIARLG